MVGSSSGNASASVVVHSISPRSTAVAASSAVNALKFEPRCQRSFTVTAAPSGTRRTPETAITYAPSSAVTIAPPSAGRSYAARIESTIAWTSAGSPSGPSGPRSVHATVNTAAASSDGRTDHGRRNGADFAISAPFDRFVDDGSPGGPPGSAQRGDGNGNQAGGSDQGPASDSSEARSRLQLPTGRRTIGRYAHAESWTVASRATGRVVRSGSGASTGTAGPRRACGRSNG